MKYHWFDSEADELIRRVAECDRLTVVVGAGASVEAGLPDWQTLVDLLLIAAASESGLEPQQAKSFSAWTLKREDLTGAGEIAKQMLGASFQSELRRALYSGHRMFAPGETARALASLYLQRRADVFELLTTNYDILIEGALRAEMSERGLDEKVVDLTDDRRLPARQLGVRHLHGVLTPGNRRKGDLILSDRDYHLMQDPNAWQESFFKSQLETNVCLFVGTSLTDPNLLRYIYRSGAGGGTHAAVFVRQQDAHVYDAETADVKELRENSQARKWLAVGVEPVFVDYYSQSAQLVWEIETATRLRGRYTSLDIRLRSWWETASREVLSTSPRAFVLNQERFHRIVSKALSTSLQILRGSGHRRGRGEKLQMSLWVYDPNRGALVNWASSDRVWRDPSTMEPVPVDWSSDFVASKAFCSGSMVSRSTEAYPATRWNHVVGFPIYAHEEGGRLPIGAVTLGSNLSRPHSQLHRAQNTVRNEVIPKLAELSEELLGPPDH